MQTQSSTSVVEQLSFEHLPPIEDLTRSGALIESHIKGQSWENSYNCITQLRKINKFHPEYIPNIIEQFSSVILDLLSNGKTLIVKNIFRLIKELFDAGQQVNVQKAVYAFLPILIKKAATDIGYMKNSAQEILTSFSNNCGYEISFVITCEFCCDKNVVVAELSIKLLSVLLQNVGQGLMQLSQNTLTVLMRSLSSIVEGKRKNLRNSALDICIFICNAIGSENYLKLMQFCLKEEEVQSMGMSMETHRVDKNKPIGLKQVIKHRKTQVLNADFFNQNKYNQNFIPLAEKQMNYENINHSNHQSYNYNGYQNGYY